MTHFGLVQHSSLTGGFVESSGTTSAPGTSSTLSGPIDSATQNFDPII